MLIYLLTVNALAFVLMLADKVRARKKLWRIPESVLILAALAGGSLGSLLGMYTFRHKTRQPLFFLGMPLILVLQIAVSVLFWHE